MKHQTLQCDLCERTATGDVPANWIATDEWDICPDCTRTIEWTLRGNGYQLDVKIDAGRLYVRSPKMALGVNGQVLEANTWTQLVGVTLGDQPPTPPKGRRKKAA